MKPFRPNLADSGFALAILAFLVVGLISYVSAMQLAAAHASSTNSLKMLEAVARLDSNVSQIKEAASQCVLSGTKEKFEQLEWRKNKLVERIRFLSEGDSEQLERINRVEPLINSAYLEATKGIQALQQPATESGEQPLSDQGAPLEQIRAVLGELSAQESQALENSWMREAKSGRLSKKITFVGTIGGLVSMIFVILLLKRDIAARKRVEEELTIQHELLIGLISHIPESVYVKDAKGRFTMANHACRKWLTGSEHGDVIGKTLYDFMTHHAAEQADLDDQAVIRSKRPIIDRVKRMQELNGEFTWWVTSKMPLFDSSGQLTELLGIQRDITEMKNQETQKAEDEFKLSAKNAWADVCPEPKPAKNGNLGKADLSRPASPVASRVTQVAAQPSQDPDKEWAAKISTPGDQPVSLSTFAEIVEMIGSDDFAKMLINVFLDETPKTLKELEEAVTQGDVEKIGRAAHTLKGSLGNFGARTAMEMAHVLEMPERTGTIEEIVKNFGEFRKELIRVMLALSSYT